MRKTMMICLVPVVLLCAGCGKSNPAGSDTPIPPAGMVWIPGGTFQMGDTNTYFRDNNPIHPIAVSSFYMDQTEVTQADYSSLMLVNPSFHIGDSLRPVEGETWFDAVLYCNARSRRDGKDTVYTYSSVVGTPGTGCFNLIELVVDFSKNGYRLPTEAEWEYACRAGSTTNFYWGLNYTWETGQDTAAIDRNAVWWHNSWDSSFSFYAPTRVGTKLPNVWGLYDMAGNVDEWCHDWYDSSYYSVSPSTNPEGPSLGQYVPPCMNRFRVQRGGSCVNYENYLCSSVRHYLPPDIRAAATGFRCVCR